MITVLAGGTGSAKLVRGLAANVPPEDLTVIANIGDNILLQGLYICPDVDTTLYALAGVLDKSRGWGFKDDTFSFLEQASKYGLEDWFKLGDRDLAIHIARTEMMKAGLTLSEVTQKIAEHLKVRQKVLPASDEHIETRIQTPKGDMHLQEFWVKLKGAPDVLGVRYRGPENPQPAPKVVEAIHDADKVVICPANPVTSIGPILHIPGIREILTQVRSRVVAVSPIVNNRPVSGPAGKFLRGVGAEVSPVGVAQLYSGFTGRLLVDETDRTAIDKIEDIGMEGIATEILMRDEVAERRVAQFIIDL
ncbi:MAG: 2-phospho-L-lactate transferase [Thaumarchaeota archaeon]|nr:2-phospho-L-lactate transferase [Nitrososphaerota archaeon]MCL5318926.1 2-phospho-L-lactate transferase [Nitrososphaerota archaeon]